MLLRKVLITCMSWYTGTPGTLRRMGGSTAAAR